MIKIISIFILYVTIAYGQAAADIQIMVHDNSGLSYPLWFGLDLTATDGIDPALAESDLPPPPPANAFDARFWLPPFNGALSSWRDYRAPGNPPAFPFSGQIQYSIKFQTTDYPVTISWSLPSTIANTSIIQDPFGGVLVNATFAGTDSLVVTNTGIVQLHVFVDYFDIVPVELTSFTAAASKESVLLNWTTATELNNRGFEIERSTETLNWEKIGYVPGFGTTTEPRSYSYVDQNVTTGTYSYRLKQIDFGGTFAYSDEVVVEVDFTPNEFALFQNYPNPFNPTTKIEYSIAASGLVTIEVYNSIGEKVSELVNRELDAGNYEVDFDGRGLSSGIYYYKISSGSFTDIKKMVLLK